MNGEYAGFKADIASATDYYPFGMEMPERTVDNNYYRFGFNTQEKTDEIAGKGNHNTALFWEYSPRIARRWNEDPKPNPSISNYAVFANSPLQFVDRGGDSVELIIGKPYVDAKGENHPYGHAALRVFNAKEGYNYVYDFGRYGRVHWNQTSGDGILNVYTDGGKYLASEMKLRSSVGYTQATTKEQDMQIVVYYNGLISGGKVYNSGAVPGGGGTAYKLANDYDIWNNNCLTLSSDGMGVIGVDFVGGEYDPRDGLKIMESTFKSKNLTRTEYNKGGEVKVTDKMGEYVVPKKTEGKKVIQQDQKVLEDMNLAPKW